MFRALDQLADYYGIKRQDPELQQKVLFYVLRDGRIRLPARRRLPPKRLLPAKRGRPGKWKEGDLGFELIENVEAIQLEERRKRPRLSGPARRPKLMSAEKAIKLLQDRFPDTWGRYDADVLLRRYYEAKKNWDYGIRVMRRLMPYTNIVRKSAGN
jgi:hypothetical protein